jgi:hypothetical protein
MVNKNQKVAIFCALGVILVALSYLVHLSKSVSTFILILGCALIGFGLGKFISKPKDIN